MDERLETIKRNLQWVDTDNIYTALNGISACLTALIDYIDEKERAARVAPYTQELDPNV